MERRLGELGFKVNTCRVEPHLCCGSVGTYSVLYTKLAYELRDRKLANLAEMKPETIASANIGCITYLQSGTGMPVKHWVELLDEALGVNGLASQRLIAGRLAWKRR